MDATSPRAQPVVQQATAHLTNLLHLADALPEFAVSPALGGATGGDGGTVTDVLAQLHAEQEALAVWLTARRAGTHQPTPRFGEGAWLTQHAHRPYQDLRTLVEDTHAALSEAVLAGDDSESLDAFEGLSGRYEWAYSVLGRCAL